MAMTKKEQAEMEALKVRLALRFTEPVEYDIPIPKPQDGLVKGFRYNSYGKRVDVACSNSIYHSIGNNDRTTTQQPIAMYSTRERALRAMRYELEMNFANELRRIDLLIEKEVAPLTNH